MCQEMANLRAMGKFLDLMDEVNKTACKTLSSIPWAMENSVWVTSDFLALKDQL